MLFVPFREGGRLLAEVTEAPEGFLHLFQRPAAIGFVVQAIFEQQADISMRDPDRRAKLMREHMQDVVDHNSHAIRERSTPAFALDYVPLRRFWGPPSGLTHARLSRVGPRPPAGTGLETEPYGAWGASTKSTHVRRKRILIVDDYPDALEIWGLYLRSLGYDVDTAEDGLRAVMQAHANRPDIVVLDLELPGITGVEAAVRLRRSPATRGIPLIAATGYSHVKQLDQARAAGFDSIIIKPCEPAALVAEIERLLEREDRECGTTGPEEVMTRSNGCRDVTNSGTPAAAELRSAVRVVHRWPRHTDEWPRSRK